MQQCFANLARQLLPVGCGRPSVVGLREDIARTLERAVAEAIAQYEQERFPDELRRLDREVREKQEIVDRRLAALERERESFRKIASGMLRLIDAVEKWMAWCEGAGGTEQHSLLWQQVKSAWADYKSLVKEA